MQGRASNPFGTDPAPTCYMHNSTTNNDKLKTHCGCSRGLARLAPCRSLKEIAERVGPSPNRIAKVKPLQVHVVGLVRVGPI